MGGLSETTETNPSRSGRAAGDVRNVRAGHSFPVGASPLVDVNLPGVVRRNAHCPAFQTTSGNFPDHSFHGGIDA
ncbi:hypothetical protein SPHV1_1210002 [Novosphingobium sp. KN65.2]|nr:hypothetical protein SPHV1_1210002 [Novosphingobium sp. KN65.2]